MLKLFQLAVVACVASLGLAQYEYDYSYGSDSYDNNEYGGGGYGGGYGGAYEMGGESAAGGGGDDGFSNTGGAGGGGSYGNYYDEYGYYGDEDTSYYEYYGYYADDSAGGYEDYYAEEYDLAVDCFLDATGKPELPKEAASCDLTFNGVDKQANKLNGGVDGVYALASCYNGKPMYRRKKSPAGEERVMWYSSTFGDWDVSRGTDPNEADILLYGGEMEHASAPLFVSGWHLGGDLKPESELGEDDYIPIKVKIACSNGKVYKSDTMATDRVSGPVLTDEEMESKYRHIYDKYAKTGPSPSMSFTFIVMMVMIVVAAVIAVPYFLGKTKKGGKKGGIAGFAQMLQESKKKASGHVH